MLSLPPELAAPILDELGLKEEELLDIELAEALTVRTGRTFDAEVADDGTYTFRNSAK